MLSQVLRRSPIFWIALFLLVCMKNFQKLLVFVRLRMEPILKVINNNIHINSSKITTPYWTLPLKLKPYLNFVNVCNRMIKFHRLTLQSRKSILHERRCQRMCKCRTSYRFKVISTWRKWRRPHWGYCSGVSNANITDWLYSVVNSGTAANILIRRCSIISTKTVTKISLKN